MSFTGASSSLSYPSPYDDGNPSPSVILVITFQGTVICHTLYPASIFGIGRPAVSPNCGVFAVLVLVATLEAPIPWESNR